jgi:gag-polyprotein putative aspartyl protease
MTDGSDANNTQWSGWLNKDPNKWMHGQVRRQNSNDHLIYIEELFDRSNTLLSLNWIDCGPDPRTPAHDAPIVAQAPAPAPTPAVTTILPASSTLDHLPVSIIDNQAHVAVTLGALPVTMLIDTGETNMTVTQSVADQLLASGLATRGPDSESRFADGSVHRHVTIIVNTMTIGGHVLHDIYAGVSPNGADMLLGFAVLNQVSGKFAINANTNTLDFN